jgi:hypothetical protein
MDVDELSTLDEGELIALTRGVIAGAEAIGEDKEQVTVAEQLLRLRRSVAGTGRSTIDREIFRAVEDMLTRLLGAGADTADDLVILQIVVLVQPEVRRGELTPIQRSLALVLNAPWASHGIRVMAARALVTLGEFGTPGLWEKLANEVGAAAYPITIRGLSLCSDEQLIRFLEAHAADRTILEALPAMLPALATALHGWRELRDLLSTLPSNSEYVEGLRATINEALVSFGVDGLDERPIPATPAGRRNIALRTQISLRYVESLPEQARPREAHLQQT